MKHTALSVANNYSGKQKNWLKSGNPIKEFLSQKDYISFKLLDGVFQFR